MTDASWQNQDGCPLWAKDTHSRMQWTGPTSEAKAQVDKLIDGRPGEWLSPNRGRDAYELPIFRFHASGCGTVTYLGVTQIVTQIRVCMPTVEATRWPAVAEYALGLECTLGIPGAHRVGARRTRVATRRDEIYFYEVDRLINSSVLVVRRYACKEGLREDAQHGIQIYSKTPIDTDLMMCIRGAAATIAEVPPPPPSSHTCPPLTDSEIVRYTEATKSCDLDRKPDDANSSAILACPDKTCARYRAVPPREVQRAAWSRVLRARVADSGPTPKQYRHHGPSRGYDQLLTGGRTPTIYGPDDEF